MASRASPYSSSFTNEWKYDVFLSFRGLDTRHGFTGHLYKALCDKGIHTFMDDQDLQRGEQITPSLVKAIQESKISIPVFSKNYASSSFCLDELVNILACINKKGKLVLPVFYDVDPSHVRHQKGGYQEAFARHEERFKDGKDKVQKWRMALRQAADLSGYHLKHGNENEYEFIEKIVKEVSRKINRAPPLHVADHPVGLESQIERVISLLNVGSDEVVMVGIHGIGGIGKTTIARGVHNLIANQFEGLCFLDCVRESSTKHGLVNLQETLVSEIVGEKDIKLGSVDKGIPIIQQKLHQKKVLLVLDDVDEQEQLRVTVGRLDWFGPGSRVIITTRDKHLLSSHGVERTYEVDFLNAKEALKLISWHAFKTDKVDPNYVDTLYRAISYASGLPWALEVIGSFLFGKRIEEWESALDHYRRIPNKKIQNILKVSFDCLEEDQQKFFLDIACFFKGYNLPHLKRILYGHHGFCPEYGIGVLIEKSLIKINKGGQVMLHDLIEGMGKEIVRQESPEEPGRRSRLWSFEDIVQVLEQNMGTSSIQIIIWDFRNFKEAIEWDGNAFKEMTNLKTLIINENCFSEGPKYLPNSLRILEWFGYPWSSLPPNFRPTKLVYLNLPQSSLMSLEFLTSMKKSLNVRVLNFQHCQHITAIPDLSGVPNLEELSIGHCENLNSIHKSVGFLHKLKVLSAHHCINLRSFPPIKLTSLEILDLSYCLSLESFPEILGKMDKVTVLDFTGTLIKEVPFSIQNLTQLKRLVLMGCGMVQIPNSILVMPEFRQLIIEKCEGLLISKQDEGEAQLSSMVLQNNIGISLCNGNISDEFFQISPSFSSNVKWLKISQANITTIPACIKECHFLRAFFIEGCKNLREIRGIPTSIETFSAKQCTCLKYLDFTLHFICTEESFLLKEIYLEGCNSLQDIRGIPPSIQTFSAKQCTSLQDLDFTLHSICTNGCFFLKEIYLEGCSSLQEIRAIPPSIETFSAIQCNSLKDLDFTLVSECSQEFCFLKKLRLQGCKRLQEIRGIPLSIETFSARDCPSLTYECRNMLLHEELHEEGGDKRFDLPGTRIPEWFEHLVDGRSICFWFRNKIPTISLGFVVGASKYMGATSPIVEINDKIKLLNVFSLNYRVTDHIFIYDEKRLMSDSNDVLLENQWNRVVCTIPGQPNKPLIKQIGVHVFRQGCSMEDILFTDPLLVEEKQRLVNMRGSQKQCMQHQKSELQMGLGRVLLSLLPPPASYNVNWHSNSMVSKRISSKHSFKARNIASRKRKLVAHSEAVIDSGISSSDSGDISHGVSDVASRNMLEDNLVSPTPSKAVFNSGISSSYIGDGDGDASQGACDIVSMKREGSRLELVFTTEEDSVLQQLSRHGCFEGSKVIGELRPSQAALMGIAHINKFKPSTSRITSHSDEILFSESVCLERPNVHSAIQKQLFLTSAEVNPAQTWIQPLFPNMH